MWRHGPFFIADPYKKQTNLIEFKNSRVRKTYADKLLFAKQLPERNRTMFSRGVFDGNVKLSTEPKRYLRTKSATYFDNRYFNHPVYQYQPFAIKKQSQILPLLITRISGHHDSNAIRIIDFVDQVCAYRSQRSMD